MTLIAGLTSVMKSPCSGAANSATLSLYVPRRPILGVIVQARVWARAEGPVVSSIVVMKALPHALAGIAVVAVIGTRFRLRCLVQQRHDNWTGFDGGERGFENTLRGPLGFHHHYDLPHVGGKDTRFGRREQRRRIEEDDAIRIAGRKALQQFVHRGAGQKL